ncbi:MAG: multicopper oxidase domain-containing protein [Cyanobium sp.]
MSSTMPGDFRGTEAGTNAHGLFGALVVEPAGSRWSDPETGDDLIHPFSKEILGTGLYVDVHQRHSADLEWGAKAPFPDPFNPDSLTREYPDPRASFREYVIFIHDEPEWAAPHRRLESNPCEEESANQDQLAHQHTAGTLMPISYRAEPMISRERELWRRIKAGEIDPNNIVVNEEQHHSSWMFGDPQTPILKAYLGDPVRIRLVHAGVKETHVFHLHVYEWHAIPYERESNTIDAITISPQTGHTFIPLYGAGNRQMVPGDVIWHCHLYPHFHHGMWGIFRTFNTLQSGISGDYFHGETGAVLREDDALLAPLPSAGFSTALRERRRLVRRLGHYPDLTPIGRLVPLPDRQPPPEPTALQPGFPLWLAGEVNQKSYTPPWHKPRAEASLEGWDVVNYDYRDPTPLELAAFNSDPKPGELFTTFPYPDRPTTLHRDALSGEELPPSRTVTHTIDVLMTPLAYNDYGWWDPHGHLYLLADAPHGVPTFSEVVSQAYEDALAETARRHPCLERGEQEALVRERGLSLPATQQEPLFLRCNQSNVLQLSLHNRLERYIPGTPFDSAWPKGIDQGCTRFANYRGECGLHVHIVKFDPIACDGASTGWNYISSPRFGRKMVYRWWADEEFGTIFTHDHMFANYRQKHGLFAALLVEPKHATFHDPQDLSRHILTGQNAVIAYEEAGESNAYREFCLGNGDWVPLFKRSQPTQDDSHSRGSTGCACSRQGVPVPADHWSGLTSHDQNEDHGHGHQQEHLHGGSGWGSDSSHHGDGCCGPFVATALVGSKTHRHLLSLSYGKPLEPPPEPDSHGDNGVFGLNYRCEPLAERPRDPSEWFSSKSFLASEGKSFGAMRAISNGDPATPLFHTWPGERIRLRLLQGSHEEQHSFQIHGLRWRRFWKDGRSPLRNQQSLGISEAFSFDIEQPGYGPGDYLWKYASAIDLWLGTWGLIRSLDPSQTPAERLPRLPGPKPALASPCPPPLEQCRRYKLVARHRTVAYGPALADPFGLVFELHDWAPPGGPWIGGGHDPIHEEGSSRLRVVDEAGGFPLHINPLVLRCRQGEWVALELFNDLPPELDVEPLAPEVPLEDRTRKVSNRVSLHADLVSFDVRQADGSNVGLNPDGTVPNRGESDDPALPSRTYLWHADAPVGAVGLMDMADIRNHRHHGLVGALVVLDPHWTPVDGPNGEGWVGPRASLHNTIDGSREEEMVLLALDGLRYFLHGNPKLPIADPVDGDLEEELDDEDQGLKGFNYRSEPSSHARGYGFTPSTPLIQVNPGDRLRLHVLGACDRPRQHSFTLHGHSWQEWPHLGSLSPWMASTSGITSGTVHSFDVEVRSEAGDYMYRSGVLKWVVEQGMWGLMRVCRSDDVEQALLEGD